MQILHPGTGHPHHVRGPQAFAFHTGGQEEPRTHPKPEDHELQAEVPDVQVPSEAHTREAACDTRHILKTAGLTHYASQ